MTREDAIKVLKQLKRIDDTICESPKNTYAVDMGIEALEQLTSYEQTINKLTKAISEQEPFDIETYCKEHFCVMVDKDVWEKAEKALEQKPCEDAISRQAVIELIGFYKNEMDCFSYSKLVEDVGLLLPFSQIQKEGDA